MSSKDEQRMAREKARPPTPAHARPCAHACAHPCARTRTYAHMRQNSHLWFPYYCSTAVPASFPARGPITPKGGGSLSPLSRLVYGIASCTLRCAGEGQDGRALPQGAPLPRQHPRRPQEAQRQQHLARDPHLAHTRCPPRPPPAPAPPRTRAVPWFVYCSILARRVLGATASGSTPLKPEPRGGTPCVAWRT